MSLRWRRSGDLLCGAKCKALADDTYLDDRLHYQLAVIEGVVIPDKHEKESGLWFWKTKDRG